MGEVGGVCGEEEVDASRLVVLADGSEAELSHSTDHCLLLAPSSAHTDFCYMDERQRHTCAGRPYPR